jgi:hypothetical protein
LLLFLLFPETSNLIFLEMLAGGLFAGRLAGSKSDRLAAGKPVIKTHKTLWVLLKNP